MLVRGIESNDITIPDVVVTEVLQGCDTDHEFETLCRALRPHRVLQTVDVTVALAAARHYRTLRRRGITVRKTIDTLIATRCILDDIPLLYSDRDFRPFVEHLSLRSALDDFESFR